MKTTEFAKLQTQFRQIFAQVQNQKTLTTKEQETLNTLTTNSLEKLDKITNSEIEIPEDFTTFLYESTKTYIEHIVNSKNLREIVKVSAVEKLFNFVNRILTNEYAKDCLIMTTQIFKNSNGTIELYSISFMEEIISLFSSDCIQIIEQIVVDEICKKLKIYFGLNPLIENQQITNENIKHFYAEVEKQHKVEVIIEIAKIMCTFFDQTFQSKGQVTSITTKFANTLECTIIAMKDPLPKETKYNYKRQ